MTTTPTEGPAKKKTGKPAHKIICTTCNHPKSFHKASQACSSYGCDCKRLRLKA